MRPSTPHVNAAFANMCIKNVYASKSCIQLAETRKETTLQICFPQAKFLNLEKKEMTLSFACNIYHHVVSQGIPPFRHFGSSKHKLYIAILIQCYCRYSYNVIITKIGGFYYNSIWMQFPWASHSPSLTALLLHQALELVVPWPTRGMAMCG